MKAAVLHEFGKPLELRDLPAPKIGPDEVLIKVKACGIDGTDMKLLDGFGYTPDLPFVIGHEPAGVIEQVGNNVNSWHTGDRVITYNFATCGKCSQCQTGRENLCQSMAGVLGVKDLPGGLAEFLKVSSKQMVQIPDSIAWHDAAVLSDAGITAYHAVKRSQIKKGQTVVVIGVGGVGAFVVQFAKLAGARVIAIEQSSIKADRALKMGADVAFEASKGDPIQFIQNNTDNLGAECVIDVVGKESTMAIAVDSLCPGGRLVLVGYTPDSYPLFGKQVAQRELEIVGSRCGSRTDLIETVDLVARGKIQSTVTSIQPLEQINEAFALLQSGESEGKIVISVS